MNFIDLDSERVRKKSNTFINLDSISDTTEGAFTDFHSGLKTINEGQTFIIASNKQMTNWDGLTNNGTIDIQGDLILR